MNEAGFKNPLASLGLQDKITAISAAALAVLLFFPWFAVTLPPEARKFLGDGAEGSIKWISAWQGKLALVFAALTIVWVLSPVFRGICEPKLPPNVRPFIPLILSGLAFVLGPLWFLMDSPEGGKTVQVFGEISAGKTFWFILAFIAGLGMLAGPIWKRMPAAAKPVT